MKSKLGLALVGLLIETLLVGCGAGPAPANPPAASVKLIEPCDLITKADADQFIGQPLKMPEKKETPAVGLKLCVYNTVSEGSGRLLQVGITQQAFMPSNGQTPKSIYSAIKDNFKNALQVDGIGDDAFITPPGLHVLKGGYYFTVAVGNSNDPKNQALLKAIGKKIDQAL